MKQEEKNFGEKAIAIVKSSGNWITTILLLFIAFNQYQQSQIKNETKTVVKYLPVNEVHTIETKPIYKIINSPKDTVFVLKTIIEKNKRDTLYKRDTLRIESNQSVAIDTINLDSLGFIVGTHVMEGQLIASHYSPELKFKTIETKTTVVKNPMRLYSSTLYSNNAAFQKPIYGVGLNLSHQKFYAGYMYDLSNKAHLFQTGFKIINL